MTWTELWDEMRTLERQMNALMRDMMSGMASVFPPINVWRGKEGAVLTAEVPGVRAEDLDVTVDRDLVTIKGKREIEREEGRAYHRRERGGGSFTRTIRLPFTVDADNVEARLENGVLRLTLPCVEEEKPKKVAVKAG